LIKADLFKLSFFRKQGQDRTERLGQQALPSAGWTVHQEEMLTARGNLHCPLCEFMTDDLIEISIDPLFFLSSLFNPCERVYLSTLI
jgi:hypothetical protein